MAKSFIFTLNRKTRSASFLYQQRKEEQTGMLYFLLSKHDKAKGTKYLSLSRSCDYNLYSKGIYQLELNYRKHNIYILVTNLKRTFK